MGYVIPLLPCGFTLGSPVGRVQNASTVLRGRHPDQIPEQPQLAAFHAKELLFKSKLFLDIYTLHPVPKDLYSYGNYQKLKVIRWVRL